MRPSKRIIAKPRPEIYFDDPDRVEKLLSRMQRSQRNNLYLQWQKGVVVTIYTWEDGYRWSIKTSDISIYPNVESETEEDATEALLSELERGRYNA